VRALITFSVPLPANLPWTRSPRRAGRRRLPPPADRRRGRTEIEELETGASGARPSSPTRVVVRHEHKRRLVDSIEQAFRFGRGD
jgi:hypothetical protein